jgi:hypothetical protein
MIEDQRPTENQVLSTLDRVGVPMSEYLNFDLPRLTTGANDVFILQKSGDRYFSEFLNHDVNIEIELLHKVLTSSDFARYSIKQTELFLLFPYYTTDSNNNVISENELSRNYPLTWNYIQKCEDRLRSRSTRQMQSEWYGYSTDRDLYILQEELIVGKMVSGKPAFAIKEGNTFTLNETRGNALPYISKHPHVNIDLWFVLSLLNSKILIFYMKMRSGNTSTNQMRISKKSLQNFPIIIPDINKQNTFRNIAKIVRYITDELTEESINEYVPNSHIIATFDGLLEAMVYELYFGEYFRNSDVHILEHLTMEVENVDLIDKSKYIETIHRLYQFVRSKENLINANMKLMDIRLQSLLSTVYKLAN